MAEDQMYSVNQVAIILKVHPLTVRRYIKDGKLKAVRLAGSIRVTQKSIDDLVQDVYPTHYGSRVGTKKQNNNPFSLTDPIFRLKGRGMSLKTGF